MESYFGNFQIGRILIFRSLAFIYFIAFLSALFQFPALLGKNGLLPVPEFLRQVSFKQAPSLFHFFYSDSFFRIIAWLGIIFSVIDMLGWPEKKPWWVSLSLWLTLWILYLSIVNVGQTFYSFGWESMLLEAGFFAAFLASSQSLTSLIPVLILRWMLFRVELGAGLIKLRSDPCWRDLTCLIYHYETQPIPNPLSWYFHRLPKRVHELSVLFSHFVQIAAPFGLFAPQRIAAISGLLIIVHQFLLIISGNYSWLNWLTIVLGFTAFSDTFIALIFPIKSLTAAGRSFFYDGISYTLACLTLFLSVQPTLNFFSRNQLMNFNYNPFHLVGSYGAFGSVTKERYEIIIEGTDDAVITPQTQWKEYEFKGKPGNLKRMPAQIAPYHLRLDWLMWFLPFSVSVTPDKVYKNGYELWFIRLMRKLLEGDTQTLRLLAYNPFEKLPPRFIRAQFYKYQYTNAEEKKATGAWWKRTLLDNYVPPVSISELRQV